MKDQRSDTLIEKESLPQASASPMTGSEATIKSLLEEGVDTIFGYPGGAIMPVYDALYHYQDRINHILVRHEQGAAHAAQGYARISGKTGVCLENGSASWRERVGQSVSISVVPVSLKTN